MNISPVSYNSRISLKGDAKVNKQQQFMSPNAPGSIGATEKLKYRPALIGVLNGITWAGVGFVFDKVLKKFFKSQTSTKTSLIVNSAIGAVFGTYAYIKAKQIEKLQTNG